MDVKKVAVIGAGVAGLAACRHLTADPERLSCVVFEQTGQIGGTWVYSERVGRDEFGLPVHSSMYQGLRTNQPKEVMGFPDFPIPAQEQSFLPAQDILKFLNDYADHFNLRPHIRFHHRVQRVSPKSDGGWTVVVSDLKTKEDSTLEFDAVMVCNGHFFQPNTPAVPGAESFPGLVLHSHDYREPGPFRGKDVVVVGAGVSGTDITLQVAAVARRVVFSHHLPRPEPSRFPGNVRQAPDVARIEGSRVHFADGTSSTADVICFCTGYLYSFPFLSPECEVRVEDHRVQPLYKQLVHIEHPTMALVGLPFDVCLGPLFDIQARFFIRTLTGEVTLPSKAEMIADTERDTEKRKQLGFVGRKAHKLGTLQAEYFSELATLGGLQPIPPVLCKLYNDLKERFHRDDLNHIRGGVYRIIDSENYVKVK